MKNGPYSRKYGGSKSGYTKGAKDTLKVVGGLILIALAVYLIVHLI